MHAYQISRENEFLKPGEAFQLVRKLLALNAQILNHQGVEVILVSRNSADSGLRIFNSIEHHGLDIQTGGIHQWRKPVPLYESHRYRPVSVRSCR